MPTAAAAAKKPGKTLNNSKEKSASVQVDKAKQVVNASLASLQTALKARIPSKADLISSASDASKALLELRASKLLSLAHKLNVEKAASTLCGLLVELKLYQEALRELASHTSVLLTFYTPTRDLDLEGPAANLSLPLPADDKLEEDLVVLLAASQYQLFSTLIKFTDAKTNWQIVGNFLTAALERPGHLLDWHAYALQAPLPAAKMKRLDSYLNSLFSAILKQTTGVDSSSSVIPYDPDSLLRLRKYAFLCVLSTDSMSLPTPTEDEKRSRTEALWDQLKRAVALYVRSTGALKKATQIACLRDEILPILTLAQARHPGLSSGDSYQAVLDQLDAFEAQHDHQALQVVTQTESLTQQPNAPKRDVADAKSQLLRIAESVDLFRKGSQDLTRLANLDQLPALLVRVATLQPWLDRVRLACYKAAKDANEVGAQERLRNALDQIAARVEALSRDLVPPLSDEVLDVHAGAIDSLTFIAKCQLESSPTLAFETLKRSLALISQSAPANSESEIKMKFTCFRFAHCVSTAFYNMGGLARAQAADASTGDAMALRFFKIACQTGSLAIEQFEAAQEDRLEELKASMPLRLALLAGCYYSIGEKQAAFSTYLQSIQASPREIFESCIPLSSVPDLESAYGGLYRSIMRFTKTGLIDLLRPASEVLLVLDISPLAMGLFVEAQISAVDRSSYKPEVFAFIQAALNKLLSLYLPEEQPLRRSKILLKQLESGSNAEMSPADALKLVQEISHLQSLAKESCAHESAHIEATARVLYSVLLFQHESYSSMDPILEQTEHILTLLNPVSIASINLYAQSSPIVQRQKLRHALLESIPPQDNLKTPNNTTKRVLSSKRASTISRAPPPSAGLQKVHTSGANIAELRVHYFQLREGLASWHLEALLHCDNLGLMSELLALLGLHSHRQSLLQICRRLFQDVDHHIWACCELARQYLVAARCRKAGLVLAGCEETAQRGAPSAAALATFYLTYAHYYGVLGDFGQRSAFHVALQALSKQNGSSNEALAKATVHYSEATDGGSLKKIEAIELLVQAHATLSVLAFLQGYFPAACLHNQHSIRLLNRSLAQTNSSHVTPAASEADAFTAPSRQSGLALARSGRTSAFRSMAQLCFCLDHLVMIYSARGSLKPAQHYAFVLAEALGSLQDSRWILRTKNTIARLSIQSAQDYCFVADTYNPSKLDRESVTHQKLQAFSNYRHGNLEQAAQELDVAQRDLSKIEVSLMTRTKAYDSPTKNGVVQTQDESLEPDLLAKILRMRLCIQCLSGEPSAVLLSELGKISHSSDSRAQLCLLEAKISFRQATTSCAKDHQLSLLQDSCLSTPRAVARLKSPKKSLMLAKLNSIELLLRNARDIAVTNCHPHVVREICLLLATVFTWQTALGQQLAVARSLKVLDLADRVTLDRELAEKHSAESRKVLTDNTWPVNDSQRFTTLAIDGQLADSVRQLTLQRQSHRLPANWKIISISLDKDHFFAALHATEEEATVFKMPYDRYGRREEEEELLTLSLASAEMQDLISSCQETCKSAKFISTDEGRLEWWAQRKALDGRMEALCINLEKRWLGFAKMLLMESCNRSGAAMATFRTSVKKALKNALLPKQAANGSKLRLDVEVRFIDLLANLAPHAVGDDELEDFVHFIMESCQMSGIAVHSDEVDLDQVVCDIRIALEKLYGEAVNRIADDAEPHVFLILGKEAQSFPWESIPCLRGRSVSRMPSVEFLWNRMAALFPTQDTVSDPPVLSVDSRKTYYLLNPGGDLARTQDSFEPWLLSQESWTGEIGKQPFDLAIEQALSTRDLFLYFGHGGAEQYITSKKIRALERCSVTFLWGCSSGLLKNNGDFDPTGNPVNFMIGGCPTLVANLWDVTDKDIDKFTKLTFAKIGLMEGEDNATRTITEAVAESRDCCTMKYINGAAPVVYGIPARLL